MNRIVETPNGFKCIVDGVHFGTWSSRAEAKAGMATEVQRASDAAKATRRPSVQLYEIVQTSQEPPRFAFVMANGTSTQGGFQTFEQAETKARLIATIEEMLA